QFSTDLAESRPDVVPLWSRSLRHPAPSGRPPLLLAHAAPGAELLGHSGLDALGLHRTRRADGPGLLELAPAGAALLAVVEEQVRRSSARRPLVPLGLVAEQTVDGVDVGAHTFAGYADDATRGCSRAL